MIVDKKATFFTSSLSFMLSFLLCTKCESLKLQALMMEPHWCNFVLNAVRPCFPVIFEALPKIILYMAATQNMNGDSLSRYARCPYQRRQCTPVSLAELIWHLNKLDHLLCSLWLTINKLLIFICLTMGKVSTFPDTPKMRLGPDETVAALNHA